MKYREIRKAPEVKNPYVEARESLRKYRILKYFENVHSLIFHSNPGFITGIATMLLEFSCKTAQNLYVVIYEQPKEPYRIPIISVGSLSRLVKYELVSDTVPYEGANLAIACEYHENPNDSFSDEAYNKLSNHMSSLKFCSGLLLSQYHAILFSGEYKNGLPYLKKVKEYSDLVNNFEKLVEDLRKV